MESQKARQAGKVSNMLSMIILLVATFAIAWHNYQGGGSETVIGGVLIGGKFVLKILPIIVIFSLITGQIQSAYTRNPEYIRSMVSGKSIVKAAVAGVLSPGGVTLGSVLQKEWSNGGNKFAIIGFIVAMSLLNWTTLLFRLPFLGEKLTGVIFGIGMIVTILGVTILMFIQNLNKT